MAEKVSLIMTTYNSRDNFSRSVQSALAQDWENLELVIVDGGSTDGTAELIRKYAEEYADSDNKAVQMQKKVRTVQWISCCRAKARKVCRNCWLS